MGIASVSVIGVLLALAYAVNAIFDYPIAAYYSGREPKLAFPFLFGMAAIEAARRETIANFLRAPTAAVVGMIALALELTQFPDSAGMAQYTLLAVFFVPVVAGNDYFGLLGRASSLVLGEVSYSLYLLHGIVLYIFMTMVLPALNWAQSPWLWALLPVFMAMIVLFASATFLLVEQPGIALGRRIVAKLDAQANAPVATVVAGIIASIAAIAVFASIIPGPFTYPSTGTDGIIFHLVPAAWVAICLAASLFFVELRGRGRSMVLAVGAALVLGVVPPLVIGLTCPLVLAALALNTRPSSASLAAGETTKMKYLTPTGGLLAALIGVNGVMPQSGRYGLFIAMAAVVAFAIYFWSKGDWQSAGITAFGTLAAAASWWWIAAYPIGGWTLGTPLLFPAAIWGHGTDIALLDALAAVLLTVGIGTNHQADGSTKWLIGSCTAIVLGAAFAAGLVERDGAAIASGALIVAALVIGMIGLNGGRMNRATMASLALAVAAWSSSNGLSDLSLAHLLQNARARSSVSKFLALATARTELPTSTSNSAYRDCHGSIDDVRGAAGDVTIEGWLAVSTSVGLVPDQTFVIVMQTPGETTNIWPAGTKKRPDLGNALIDAGYAVRLIIPPGSYQLTLARRYQGYVVRCETLTRTVTVR